MTTYNRSSGQWSEEAGKSSRGRMTPHVDGMQSFALRFNQTLRLQRSCPATLINIAAAAPSEMSRLCDPTLVCLMISLAARNKHTMQPAIHIYGHACSNTF